MQENTFTEYTCRRAVIGDAPSITDFNIRMALETEGINLTPSIVKRGVETVFEREEKGRYYVATISEGDNEKVIGSCLITMEWSDWRCCDYFYLQSVFIEPEHRRKGVFSLLYKFVESECIKAGTASLRLYVDKGNEKAKQSYLKLGMEVSHYEMFEKNFYEK
ncbi:GCN5-related N-acetyltransferase [Naegleria gruberi]|uniref:GCN5-related N-acetyltransferase n=1 Tax=Naegleria gruberi TaxID=5762 RepID=D2VJ18_NAEGR|nr:GCN5-related N-acetyltransferase [Naegleria gruberi]EFC43124.1 GCN5-related N-acetyltransferase [Naegleria gruberi]|eukprot:XP_002675868.1 GCN5-related N-acetyltransferase [Naegleria gruberi strain NEG-M]